MTIRWALVGPGRHAARSVVAALRGAAGGTLAAVLSRDLARGQAFAAQHKIPRVHGSFEALIDDPGIDAIYDATPDGLHAGHAIAAAAAKKHALVEKPLATSVADARTAIAAAARNGVVLGVVFNQRHEAAHQEARRLVRAGALGELVLLHVQIPLRVAVPLVPQAPSWRNDPAMRPGGIGWSIGDHAFDTLSYLAGEDIVEVAAFTDASADANERSAGLLLRLASGAIGFAAASSKIPFARPPFELNGTTGSLAIANSFTYLTGAGADPRPTLTLTTASGTIVRRFDPSDCFRLEIEQFNRAIEGKGAPMTPAADGLRAVAIGAAVFDATRQRRAAKVADFL